MLSPVLGTGHLVAIVSIVMISRRSDNTRVGKNILPDHLVGWFINIIDRNDVIDDGEGTACLNAKPRVSGAMCLDGVGVHSPIMAGN